MEARRVPAGVKLTSWIGLYILIYFLSIPSVPVSEESYDFWNRTSALFGESDVEGFIGIALLFSSAIITSIIHLMIINLIERKIFNKNN